jgi:hypothetical protein
MIFGGYILRLTFELAHCCAARFSHSRPRFISLDSTTFDCPVPVGSILESEAMVVHTSPSTRYSPLLPCPISCLSSQSPNFMSNFLSLCLLAIFSSAVTVVIPTLTPRHPRQSPAESKSASSQQSVTSTPDKKPPRGPLRIRLVWKAPGGFCRQSTLSSWSGSLQRGSSPGGQSFWFLFSLVFGKIGF